MASSIKKRSPLYEQVKQRILEIIMQRQLKAHDPIPSEGELASLCSVSRMTSKIALQQLTEEGIVYRRPRRGTYLSDIDLKVIQSKLSSVPVPIKKQYFALIIPVLDDFTGNIVKSVEKMARSKGYHVIIHCTDNEFETEEQLLKSVSVKEDIIGILLFPTDRITCGNELLRLKLTNYPIVILDRVFKEVHFDSICHNHFQGAYEMTKFLINAGRKQISFISEPLEMADSRMQRYQGYWQALMDHRLSINPEHLLFVENMDYDRESDFFQSSLFNMLESYITRNQTMDAVFCSHDFLAIRLMQVALKKGLQIPEQLSIVGFSDNKVIDYAQIPLTTVRQPTGPIGEMAIELLIRRIDNPDAEIKTIQIPTCIIKRKSVI